MTRQEIDKVIDDLWYFGKEVVREFDNDRKKTYVLFGEGRIPVEDWRDGNMAYTMRDIAKISYDKGYEDGRRARNDNRRV